MAQQEEKLQLLKDILLLEDREITHAITKRLDRLTETLEERKNLSKRVDPIIQQKLDEFVKEIPKTLGPTITRTLKEEIANSKDAVVEALYPIIGKMIKRYIQNEIKILSENINNKVSSAFSFDGIKRKMRSKFTGVKEGDIILATANKPIINELFVIEKGSGILLGNYSNTQTIDKDMVSGMLTAIKSFVEDAFEGGEQNLESIEYELYTIHIQNFYSYYMAFVISGNYDQSFEDKLEDKILRISKNLSAKIKSLSKEEISIILKEFSTSFND